MNIWEDGENMSEAAITKEVKEAIEQYRKVTIEEITRVMEEVYRNTPNSEIKPDEIKAYGNKAFEDLISSKFAELIKAQIKNEQA